MRLVLGGSPNWYLSSGAAVHPTRGVEWTAWACRDAVDVVSFARGGRAVQRRVSIAAVAEAQRGGRVVAVAFVDEPIGAAPLDDAQAAAEPEEGEMPAAGPRLAVADSSGHVTLWHVDSVVRAGAHNAHGGAQIQAIACSATVVASGDKKGGICLWRVDGVQGLFGIPALAGAGGVSALAFASHDPTVLAAGHTSGAIIVRRIGADGTEGDILHRLRSHEDEILSLAWQPSGAHLLASGSRDRTVRVWADAHTAGASAVAQHVLRIPREGGVGGGDVPLARVWLSVAWTRSGELVCGSFSGTLLRWSLSAPAADAPPPEPVAENAGGKNKRSRRAAAAAAGSATGAAPPRRLPLVHTRTLFSVCTSRCPHEDVCLTVSMDRQVALWDLTTDRPVWRAATLGGFAYALEASPHDGGAVMAVACGDQSVHHVQSAAALEGSGAAAAPTAAPQVLWRGLHGKATAAAWHPTREALLAVATADGALAVFDTASGRSGGGAAVHAGSVHSLAWLHFGKRGSDGGGGWRIVSVGADGALRVSDPGDWDAPAAAWAIADGAAPGRAATDVAALHLTAAADDGKTALVAVGHGDGSVRVVHAHGGRHAPLLDFVGQRGAVHRLKWRAPADGHALLACASASGAVAIVRVAVEPPPAAHEDGAPLPVSHCERVLLAAGGAGKPVQALAWSPHEAALLATGGADGVIRVWEALSGHCRWALRGHVGRVLCLSWSDVAPDAIFSGGEDQTVRVWRAAADAVAEPVVASPPSDATAAAPAATPPPSAPTKRTRTGGSGRPEKRLRALLPLSKTANEPRRVLLGSIARRAAGDVPPSEPANAVGIDALLDADRGALSELLAREASAHQQGDSAAAAEMALALRLFSGDAEGAIEAAAAGARDADGLMFAALLAPAAGVDVWEGVVERLAGALEAAGEAHRAAMCWIAVHRPAEAIHVYRRAALLREALVVARCRLAPDDPLALEVMRELGEAFEAKGQVELAANCFLAANVPAAAVRCLLRKDNAALWESASAVARRIGDPVATPSALRAALLFQQSGDASGALRVLASLPQPESAVFGAVVALLQLPDDGADDAQRRALLAKRLGSAQCDDASRAAFETHSGALREYMATWEQLARALADVDAWLRAPRTAPA